MHLPDFYVRGEIMKKDKDENGRIKLMLIINPHSGKRKLNFSTGKIADIFDKGNMEIAAYFTSPEYNADYIVKKHIGECDIVGCCGGDGTISETISGIMQSDIKKPLGCIPMGTTNDLARSLKLNTNSVKAAKTIAAGELSPFDIGSFNDKYFVYIASFGAFTEVSYATPQKAKNIFGRLAYMFGAVKYLHKIKSHHVKIITDDRSCEGDYIFGAVTNSTSVAGVFKFDNDDVDFADGKFEVLLIKRPKNIMNALGTVLSMFNKSYKHDNIIFFHASEIVITSEESLDWAVDGEHRNDGKSINIRNNHCAIDIIMKKHGKH